MPHTHKRRTRLAAASTLAFALVALAMPVAATSERVTSGDVHAFAASADPAIRGRAMMVRTADGRTIVTIEVRGLQPSTAYHVHVHVQACADNNAGGHYRFDLAGPAYPPNEIWPEFTTNAAGVGIGRTMVDAVADSSALAVVVHAPGGAKIGCADLG